MRAGSGTAIHVPAVATGEAAVGKSAAQIGKRPSVKGERVRKLSVRLISASSSMIRSGGSQMTDPTPRSERALSEHLGLRLTAFTALYVAQGLPYGLLAVAVPAYMAERGFSARETTCAAEACRKCICVA